MAWDALIAIADLLLCWWPWSDNDKQSRRSEIPQTGSVPSVPPRD